VPGAKHQTLTSLFRDNPALGLRLLREAIDVSLPADVQARLHTAQFTDLRPPEYAADAASLIEDAAGNVLGALVTEVQLSPDDLKPSSWLSYTATLHRTLLVPVTVLAIAITEEMARWCARPYPYNHLGSTFQPLVIGPGLIPRITEVEQAKQNPELALLSVAAHGQEPGAETIGIAAYLASGVLDTNRGARYADVIMAWLSDAARRAMEEYMSEHSYEFQSEFARKYEKRGIDKGIKKGITKGRKQGLIEAIEVMCDALSIPLSEEQRKVLRRAGIERLQNILAARRHVEAVAGRSMTAPDVHFDLRSKALRRLVKAALRDCPFLSEFARRHFVKGYVEGFERGRRLSIEALAEELGIPLTAAQREELNEADVERLDQIWAALRDEERWPRERRRDAVKRVSSR
jgi:hypothetical protein